MRAFSNSIVLLLAMGPFSSDAGEMGFDVQRLQQQRDHQQLQLRLKMQQQNERALRPPSDAASDFRRNQLELEQRQRQQLLLEQQARESIVPAPEAAGAVAQAGRDRAAAEQASRLEAERRNELPVSGR